MPDLFQRLLVRKGTTSVFQNVEWSIVLRDSVSRAVTWARPRGQSGRRRNWSRFSTVSSSATTREPVTSSPALSVIACSTRVSATSRAKPLFQLKVTSRTTEAGTKPNSANSQHSVRGLDQKNLLRRLTRTSRVRRASSSTRPPTEPWKVRRQGTAYTSRPLSSSMTPVLNSKSLFRLDLEASTCQTVWAKKTQI